jgi:hypothetical protein
VTGRVITKSTKRGATSLDVAPPPVRRAITAVLREHRALGLWILCGECGVDGVAAMAGRLDHEGDATIYRHGARTWVVASDDVAIIEEWQDQRRALIDYGTDSASRGLSDWLRGPVSTAVRRRLKPAAYRRHVSVGVELLNAIARERLVALADGDEHLLWKLTSRVGVPADRIEPHSTDRVHRLIDEATAEFLHPRVEP